MSNKVIKTNKMFCCITKGKLLIIIGLKTVFYDYHTSDHVKGSLVVLGNLRHNNPPPKEKNTQFEKEFIAKI